ncbi:hypothetical protein QQP08_004901 [Theobroma cacao]|nr:hypothetical protein QQP08_004901 [Theobroma cacao]
MRIKLRTFFKYIHVITSSSHSSSMPYMVHTNVSSIQSSLSRTCVHMVEDERWACNGLPSDIVVGHGSQAFFMSICGIYS